MEPTNIGMMDSTETQLDDFKNTQTETQLDDSKDTQTMVYIYTFENYLLRTTTQLSQSILQHLPKDLTPYLAKHFEWFEVQFINFNIPISSNTFKKAVLEKKLLGYSSNIVTHGEDRYFYFGVLPARFQKGESYKPNPLLKLTRISKPRKDLYLEYVWPLLLLLQPPIKTCSQCNQDSVFLGGCKNTNCSNYSMVELQDEEIKLSDVLSDLGKRIEPERACLSCLRCKSCRKKGSLCHRHRICRHNTLKKVSNIRSALVKEGLL